jgi:hypothetical protein
MENSKKNKEQLLKEIDKLKLSVWKNMKVSSKSRRRRYGIE